jgi:hypothetical protein
MRARGFCMRAMLEVYNSMFVSVVSYAIPVWGGLSIGGLNRLQVLQNNAIRAITGLKKFDSVGEKMKQLKLRNIETIYRISLLCMGFKLINGMIRHDLSCRLVQNHSTITRTHLQLIPPNTKFSIMQKSFLYKMITEWNLCDESIRMAGSYGIFRNKLLKSFSYDSDGDELS